MSTSFVPSLQHLTCSSLVVSLFNRLEVQNHFRLKKYDDIKFEVTEKISQLTPCIPLQEKLKTFIDPLICELDDWLKIFEHKWYGYDSVFDAVLETLPQCWLSDGTINREMSARSVVKNEKMRPINRFIFACKYCFFDDVLDLWKILFKIEKAYLRHRSTPFVKHWVEWLESNQRLGNSIKDWDFFVTWTLGTPLWNSNLYILKHALGTLSPAEKRQYLLKALIGKEVTQDVMRFCMSMMTKDEQEQIFRESPVEVFRCISSWPMQSLFYDIVDKLQPHLTEETFCKILKMVLEKIEGQKRVCVQLIEIFQNFWSRSPRHLQNIAIKDARYSKQLQFLLAFDVSQEFPKGKFLDLFETESPNTLLTPQLIEEQRQERAARMRRLYRDLL